MNFSKTILNWYAINGRELPWRQTTNPYAIWLSEVIMQQTRIAQGTAYWERFMKRWPNVHELAKATEDEVLREWQGLGYYSRARNLHKAAQQIVGLGRFPETYKELKQLKGIGEYTAAAISSISFAEPVAVVDGNVYRVLARYFGIDTPIDSTEGKKVFKAMAQEYLPKEAPAAYNQGLMDFGAIQCTPTSPNCEVCPLIDTCFAANNNKVADLPVKAKKTKQRERHFSFIYIRCNGETAIRRRGAGDIWQGLWELPTKELLGNAIENATLIKKNVKHILTHQIIFADFYLLETNVPPTLPADYIWIKESEIERYALPRLIDLLVKSL
ncbi:A/G-specific adenine glycosylase [Prevotella intermedia]|uniref:Adenine DNA glycosylase n=1 Tax=Prevotella intermedia TaxID=28131 RepID=A0AAJ3RHH4_PREIN|nr:A/G-specific adenine glycosylase [Prevotella intermedia]ATV38070.1 A/G-specific adenine glycosylase [Prevotella intermedia]PIK17963.1 A/G-specific adenine glycosylase [Prevotella intermedia]